MGHWYCPESPTREIEALSKEEAERELECAGCPESVRENCGGPLKGRSLKVSTYSLATTPSISSFMDALEKARKDLANLREYDPGKIIVTCLDLEKSLLLLLTEAIRELRLGVDGDV